MMVSVSEFNKYLIEQVGQPYVWGGQHTFLTPENYVDVITRKESNLVYRETAIHYCAKLFNAGASVLYGYDCSGLGMFYLQNYTHVLPHDLSANGMMGLCKIVSSPKKGYWVFRLKKGEASHIGYMISDTEVVHAKGRAYGVVREKYKASYWHRVGIPNCVYLGDEPVYEIAVKGSVRVREGNGVTTPKICTVKNCRLPYLGQATESPYWYMTEVKGKPGFITSNKRYTTLVEV